MGKRSACVRLHSRRERERERERELEVAWNWHPFHTCFFIPLFFLGVGGCSLAVLVWAKARQKPSQPDRERERERERERGGRWHRGEKGGRRGPHPTHGRCHLLYYYA